MMSWEQGLEWEEKLLVELDCLKSQEILRLSLIIRQN
jgi:hypothetical protein